MKVRVEIPDRAPPRRDEDAGRTAVAVQELDASPGRPLPEELRREMEARFGCDFSEVRIHQDDRADGSARALGARAFTIGNDIYFQAGAFEPTKLDGRRLLAHELAHTIQQAQAGERVPKLTAKLALESMTARRAEERQASDAAEIALSGKRFESGTVRPTGEAAAGQSAPHVARWLDTIPGDRASHSAANPFVEELALDVVHALEHDPADAGAHTQRRLSRLEAATRAAVIGRVQEMLTPDQRERSAKALSGAAVTEEQPSTGVSQATSATSASRENAVRSARASAGPEVEQPVPAEAETATPHADGTTGADGAARAGGAAEHAEPAGAEVETAAAHADAAAAHARAAAPRKAESIAGVGDRAARDAAKKAAAGRGAAGKAPAESLKPGTDKQLAAAAGAVVAPEGAPQGLAGKLGGAGAAGQSPTAAAAQSDGGEADAQPDLGPADALDSKVDARTRERIAKAEARGEELGKKQAGATTPAHTATPSAHAAAAIAAKQPDQSAAEVAAEAEAHAEARDALEAIAAQEPSGATEPDTSAVAAQSASRVIEPSPTDGNSYHPPTQPAGAEAEADVEPAGAGPDAEVESGAEADAESAPGAGAEPDAEAEAGAEVEPAGAEVEPAGAEVEPAGAEYAAQAAPGDGVEPATGTEPATGAEPAAPPAEPPPAAPTVAHEPEAASDSDRAVAAEASAAERDEAPAGDATAAASEPDTGTTTDPGTSDTGTDTPGADTPGTDTPGADTPGTDTPGADTPGTETPGTEAAAQEATDGAGEADAGSGDAPAAGGDTSGGDCGPDSPPGVGGGGGGGSPIGEPQPEPEPDVSQAEPEDAMATVATLAPGPAQRTLRGVKAASDKAVTDKRDDFAANPPSLERPTGSPQTRGGTGGPQGAATTLSKGGRAERAHGKGKTPKTVPPPLPPAPPSPVQAVRPPTFTGDPHTPMTPQQAQAFIASIWRLPVTDPGLDMTAGPSPTVDMTGDADPNHVTEQRAKSDASVAAAASDGEQQAAAPLGEHDIYPAVKPETLRAEVPKASRPAGAKAGATGGSGAGAGAGSGAGARAGAAATAGPGAAATTGARPGIAGAIAAGVNAAGAAGQQASAAGAGGGGGSGGLAGAGGPDPVEIIAKEQSAGEVQNAATNAQGQMTTGRETQENSVDKANRNAQAEIDKEVQENSKEQADQRGQALTQVSGERRGWTTEQQKKLADHSTAADEEMGQVDTQVVAKRREADRQAVAEIDDGNKKAAAAKREGEAKAEAERKKGEEESSGGVLGWIADKARAAFNAIKSAIKAAFDWAREKIRKAIDWAIEKATQIIDAARDAIVSAIRAIGDALLALGDVLLSWFPSLHERYRKKIHELVDRAVAKVDELADALKAKVKAALNALAAAIDSVLAAYENALLAAVDFVQSAVEGAIDKARAFINMLEKWGALIADIASAPGQWLSNLGSSAYDGVRNHLWKAFKCQAKEWVGSKVQDVVGVPIELIKMLARGGIAFAQIVSMVWQGLIPAIPGILIELVVEQIVKALVPGLGAIMAIIDTLRAAWSTLKRIIAAFEKFFAFLRAVRAGNAGRQFAELLAMAAVVVIDFLSNFLVKKLIKPAKPIGGRLAQLGKKIMAQLNAVGKAVKRGARKAIRAVKAGARKAAAAVRKAAVSLKQSAAKAGRTIAKVAGRAGQTVKRGARRVTAAVRRGAGRAMHVIEKRFPRVARILKKGSGLVRRVTGRVRRRWHRTKAWVRHKRRQLKRWRQNRRRQRRVTAGQRLHRAVAAIRPPLEAILARGVVPAYLRVRLLAWRLRWRLRSLRVEGDTIIARVNPEEPVTAVASLPLAERLERVLVTAEEAYVSQLAITQPERITEVEEAVAQAREPGTAPFRDLSFVQQALFFRAVADEPGRFRGLRGPRSFGSSAARFTIGGSRRRPAGFRVTYPEHERPTVPVLPARQRVLAMRSGSYPDIAQYARRYARVLGRDPSELIAAASGRSAAELESTADRLLASSPGARGHANQLRPGLIANLQSLSLVRTMESARKPGQMVAQALSAATGGPLEETLLADPMATFGSGTQADIEAGRPARGNVEALRKARETRLDRIKRIFRRLRVLVRRGKVLGAKGSLESAVKAVEDRFQALLDAEKGKLGEEDMSRLEQDLTIAVVRFMETYHGDGTP